ncbi:MAG: hypothetical protein HYV16_06045 [Gammaproteobacteria bacterium]|nr:hypothetical protein [Gammaproteobacteria bacterium]
MKTLATLALLTLSALPVHAADEVEAAIDEAQSAYEKGDMSKAASQLDYAASLIRQKKAEAFKTVLPDALSGWEAGEAESSAAAGALFGGGITASRNYNKGEASVKLEIITDSPLLQGMMGLIANPAFATMSGGKLVQINGQQAIVENPQDNPKLSLVVGGKTLIKVEAMGASLEDVQAYAKAVDLDKLGKI